MGPRWIHWRILQISKEEIIPIPKNHTNSISFTGHKQENFLLHYQWWGNHYPDAKTKDITSKVEISISHDQKFKNPWQYISILNSKNVWRELYTTTKKALFQVCKTDLTTNVIHHTSRLKKKNNMIISPHAEISF